MSQKHHTHSRFLEDIRFLLRKKLADGWSVYFACLPVVSIVSLSTQHNTWLSYLPLLSPDSLSLSPQVSFVLVNKVRDYSYPTYKIILAVLIMSPIVLCIVVQVFLQIKRRDITGLLRSTPNWGPPDYKSKFFRRKYNPKSEVRFKRLKQVGRE
jgi:hypothetical protein